MAQALRVPVATARAAEIAHPMMFRPAAETAQPVTFRPAAETVWPVTIRPAMETVRPVTIRPAMAARLAKRRLQRLRCFPFRAPRNVRMMRTFPQGALPTISRPVLCR